MGWFCPCRHHAQRPPKFSPSREPKVRVSSFLNEHDGREDGAALSATQPLPGSEAARPLQCHSSEAGVSLAVSTNGGWRAAGRRGGFLLTWASVCSALTTKVLPPSSGIEGPSRMGQMTKLLVFASVDDKKAAWSFEHRQHRGMAPGYGSIGIRSQQHGSSSPLLSMSSETFQEICSDRQAHTWHPATKT